MQSDLKLLLVDDNPMALALSPNALAPPAKVAAPAATAALLKAPDRAPGPLVSAFAMPGIDGRPLAAKLKGRERTSRLPVLLATKADLSKKLTGDAAVFQVLGWEAGNFQINFEAETRHGTATLHTQGLRTEGLRLVDASRRDPGSDSEEEEDVLLDS